MFKCPQNGSENATKMLENVQLKTCIIASETVCKNATESTHNAIKNAHEIPHKMPMRLTSICQKNCMLKCPRNATENAIRMQENVPLKICFNASETVQK
jgi:hypothetical protein